MQEVSKKLAPILQLGVDHQTEADEEEREEDKSKDQQKKEVLVQEATEVREAIRGRKESVIVKDTRVLWAAANHDIQLIGSSWIHFSEIYHYGNPITCDIIFTWHCTPYNRSSDFHISPCIKCNTVTPIIF